MIVDPEQLRRVINNIISNSLKYMDKEQGIITMNVRDVGDFIQVDGRFQKLIERRQRDRSVDCEEDRRGARRQDLGDKHGGERNRDVFCSKKVSGGTDE